ncbi:MAG: hypothetical protein KME50_27255 [Nostoc desertorum CM1-VF14]|nr:hypothetical protein [Nostoc desertorum CM1-VF14]
MEVAQKWAVAAAGCQMSGRSLNSYFGSVRLSVKNLNPGTYLVQIQVYGAKSLPANQSSWAI